MDPFDLRIRNETYRTFVERGGAPTVHQLADELGLAVPDVEASWRRLHDLHAIVLEADGRTLRMANPFSARPTRFRVDTGDRSWFANCAWDAFGVCAALHVDGHIATTCPDCEAPIEIDVVDEQPDTTTLLFHSLVPAAQWWDDIVFT
jgi:transposase InsO family protein